MERRNPRNAAPRLPGAGGRIARTPVEAQPNPVRSSGPVGARSSAATPPNLVLLGEFGRAHGLRGEIRLKSYTADPLAIAGYGPLAGGDGRLFVLTGVRQAAGDQPDLLVARVEGVASREAAEALNRTPLHVGRERLAAATEEDEFLLADLIGIAVEDPAGAPIGIVSAVPNFGGGDLLEIACPGSRQTLLVPFTKTFVPVLDLPARRVVVDMPPNSDGDETDERP